MNWLSPLRRFLRLHAPEAHRRLPMQEDSLAHEHEAMPATEESLIHDPQGDDQPLHSIRDGNTRRTRNRSEFARHAATARDQDSASSRALQGDRGIASVNRQRPLQHRLTNGMAMALVGTLGLALLGWYYTRLMAAPATAQRSAQQASMAQAQGEMALPALGAVSTVNATQVGSQWLGNAPPLPEPAGHAEGLPADAYGSVHGSVNAGSGEATPAEAALARRLTGPAFAAVAQQGTAESVTMPVMPSMGPGPASGVAAVGQAGGVSTLLTPTSTPAVRAQVLPTQRLLLPKGAFIDCTLETAIDSSLPGLTTCITATDTFSADGTVVLMERGTKLVGETRGEVQQGSARLFVLWTEARTPTGVVVPLASPGTDELGRSGLSGAVNRHFMDRFGAAILVSVIDGVIQSAVLSRSSRNNSDTVVVNPSATQDILTEALKSTINIPPTLTKQNGDRIQILVARDLDFRSVYELRTTHAGR